MTALANQIPVIMHTTSTAVAAQPKVEEMVINWHITEACNYSCKFCYAKWGQPDELHRQPGALNAMMQQLSDYFIASNNPVKQALGYKKVRLNFAGGEPGLLKGRFSEALKSAKAAGFEVSIITNGHFLTDDFIRDHAQITDMVGISYDSQTREGRAAIGREDRHGNQLDNQELLRRIQLLRHYNPSVKIKLNTVINSENYQEDFSDFIRQVAPAKWKALRVLPVLDDITLAVSDQQFAGFVARHSDQNLPMVTEDNSEMAGSYLMIDPKGRFYQNSLGKTGYQYSQPILQAGAGPAMQQIDFDPLHFARRY